MILIKTRKLSYFLNDKMIFSNLLEVGPIAFMEVICKLNNSHLFRKAFVVYELINNKRCAWRWVCKNYLISTKCEWNNCLFLKFFHRLDDADISVFSKQKNVMRKRKCGSRSSLLELKETRGKRAIHFLPTVPSKISCK